MRAGRALRVWPKARSSAGSPRLSSTRAPGDIDKVRAFIQSTGVEGYIACASAVRDMAQTTMLLRIKAPTLVMTGRQDPACSVDHATVLHRMIGGSQLVILEDAAHLSNIEQPQAFNLALRNFIDRVDDSLQKTSRKD